MYKVAIIGAGISGLSVAQILNPKYKVTVFEKEDRPGGLIKCNRINGNLFHTCGGHVFNSKRKDVLDWFWQFFHREQEFVKATRNSVIFTHGGLKIPYPIENHAYMLPEKEAKNFVNDLVKMAQLDPKSPIDNFEEFLIKRFGNTLYKEYFEPYNKKIWRRPLCHVPISWLEGKLPMPTLEEIIYNNLKHVKEKDFVHSTFWYEKFEGSQLIADRLSLGLDIRYSSFIDSLSYKKGKWQVGCDEEQFDIVVFSGNLKSLPSIINGISIEQFGMHIDKLEYHGTTSVFCEIDKNPFSWIYLPSEDYEAHRIICTGNFSSTNNVNADILTGTIEFTDRVTEDIIKKNLAKMPLHPHYICHKYNEYTYPIQSNNTRMIIKDLKFELAKYKLLLTGRFADWEYYNMDAAIGAAMDLCENINT